MELARIAIVLGSRGTDSIEHIRYFGAQMYFKKCGLNYQLVHFYNLGKPHFPAAVPNAVRSQSFSLLGAGTKKEMMQAAAVMPTETHNAGA